jgi:ABC-type bacteriocin/lantibiotic exporter with double-glycine peptidase domain
MSGPSARRFLAPEVIQTSAMDCGPAALKALLEGFGIQASYGRLREACQTSVDGTSIDTLEVLAGMLGLEAEQITLPVESLLLPEASALPALVVVTLPSGLTHFLVVWRVHGRWVQVMDPARGRRWMRATQLLREVYVHENRVDAAAFREWAESDGFRDPLARRLRRLGVEAEPLLYEALREPGWRDIAAIDAAARATEALVERAGLGGRAADAFAALHASARAGDGLLGQDFWMARAAPGSEGELLVRGAIALRVVGRREEPVPDVPSEVAAVVAGGEVGPAAKLIELLRADGIWRWAPLMAGLAVAAAGSVFEALLFRGFLDVGRRLQLFEQRLLAAGALLLLVGALFCLEWPVWRGVWGIGRRLELRLRRAFLEKIPRVGDRYFHSRPVSDMAERAHQVHWLRNLPAQGGLLVRAASELAMTTAGIIWLDPPSAPIALLLAAAMVGVPLVFQPALVERDLRMRSHAGGLARFYLDALMGLIPIRAHAGEDAIKREHGERLGEWAQAAWAGARTTVTAEAVQALAGFGLAAWLLFHYLVTAPGSGWALLLVYWALALPVLGQEIGFLIAQYPHHRNVTLRLVEPLSAPEAGAGGEVDSRQSTVDSSGGEGAGVGAEDRTPSTPTLSTPPQTPSTPELSTVDCRLSTSPPRGVSLTLDTVTVRASGQQILEVERLAIAAGEHVAIVGSSGGGKSSLAGLLLGWHEPTAGRVLADGQPLLGASLERLRRQTVWVEPSVYLWNRSLLDNLRYGVGAQPVEPAIEEADLDEVLGRLPIGLQTPLGEGGALLSGGEGQRVRLGRGVLRASPRLVILDEAFRGLERARRTALLGRGRARWRDATLLCITHDIVDTLAFSRVLVVAGGRIVEDGAPSELATQESRFRELLEADRRIRERFSGAEWRRIVVEGGAVRDGGSR